MFQYTRDVFPDEGAGAEATLSAGGWPGGPGGQAAAPGALAVMRGRMMGEH